MKQIKTVIHIHTEYSSDCDVSLEALAWSVVNERIGCVAITDHDTIEGAVRFREMTNAEVIVGEEISTREGHLIGLFLQERIPPGLGVRETALAIREQGGLVLVPHPFVRVFSCGLRDHLDLIADMIDAVEINNAQNLRRRPDRRARRYAQEMGLVSYVGADTHLVGTLAPCFQLMRPFTGPADFLDALAAAELWPGRHSLRYFVTMAHKIAWMAAGLPRARRVDRAGGSGRSITPTSDVAEPVHT
jgi:predicted metal-dependent phosphoesterase TrpH